MRVLMAVDDDERYGDVLRSLEWCLALGPDDEVLVAHVVATLRWMPFRDASDPGWAGTERAIMDRVDDFLGETVRGLEERGLRARPMRLEGDVAEQILSASAANEADVIVLGALGQARSQDFLVGSVAEKVQSLSGRDVLLVRSARDGSGADGARFRAVLAVDGSTESLEAIDAFAAKVRAERAEIQVVHVLDVPSVSFDVALASEEAGSSTVPPALRERADAAIRGALEALDRHGLTASSSLRRGRAATEILQEAESFGADLVVVAAHRGEGAGRRPLLGTVSRRVSRHANCSVLIVGPRASEASS